MRSGRALAAAVCGSILALAACSDGGGDPVVLPTATAPTTAATETESPSNSPSTEPTPTTTLVLPPTQVPEADAFVARFFDAYNNAKETGTFSALDALYLPQCSGCLELRSELEAWLAAGGSVQGADWVVSAQSSERFADGVNATVIAYRTSGSVTNASGSTTQVSQLDPQLILVDLQPGEPWSVLNLVLTAQ